MAARSKPGCACGKTSPGTGGQLGLDELMIVNPGSFRTATYSLADDGNLYRIQGQGQDAARHGVGSYFLGDDGTLYQVQGIDADGTPELGDAAAGARGAAPAIQPPAIFSARTARCTNSFHRAGTTRVESSLKRVYARHRRLYISRRGNCKGAVMAKVQGVKEKLHSPLYDAFFVKDELKAGSDKKTFTDFMTDPRVIRFFVDIQNKTKLETNLQASGVLPSLNTFEARALRVVVSNLHRVDPTQRGPKQEMKAERNEAELLADLIYNSVTTLIVGEKTMIEMPTFWFPAGAGVSPGYPTVSNHGEPDPTATFRFAEPVYIEPQQ
ncbi:MAG: hypothetical protein ABI831_26055, partial [Betaproteobacteria bacterium]